MPIEIRDVRTRKDLKAFIYLPEKIHAGHKNWVHPIYMDDWKYFDKDKNKAFGYCDTTLLLACRDGRIVGRGYNQREGKRDPSAHAELLAIRRAAKRLSNWRLTGSTLYVTLEPCIMCMGAILLARIQRVVFGCFDPKGGAAGSLYDLSCDRRLNHRVELVAGVRQDECSILLSGFFATLRAEKKRVRIEV